MAEVFKYEKATKVQALAIPLALEGRDVLAMAKTGTGKTLAFLVPIIELLSRKQTSPKGVSMLVISPTRELAQQIEEEAKALLTFHRSFTTQCVVGGTKVNKDKSKMNNRMPTILIATPGRLYDLLTTFAPLAAAMRGLTALALDEADRLLDMGFRPDLLRILKLLPPANSRQSLLFSATFPQDVASLAKIAMRADYERVDAVGKDTSTNKQVIQERVICSSYERQFGALYDALTSHMAAEPEFKIMVFFVTARQTGFMAELFNAMGVRVLETHSRKSQAHRTRVANEFRHTPKRILFSSDVSARGLDYDDVTFVIQVGVPSERAQYIHRIGRTARAGKAGHGLVILMDFEKNYAGRMLKGLPITDTDINTAPQFFSQTLPNGLRNVPRKTKCQTYQANLGYYNGAQRKLGWNATELVRVMGTFATAMGLAEPPALLARTIGKMGLKGTPGLRVTKNLDY